MKVRIFDENHEKDLEGSINEFISGNELNIVDIKYQVSIAISGDDQIYCFTAMVIYNEK